MQRKGRREQERAKAEVEKEEGKRIEIRPKKNNEG